MNKIVIAFTLLLVLSGCGISNSGPTEAAEISSFPVMLEGELVVSVAEGNVDSSGYSEFNWADLEVGGEVYPVEVSGSLLKRAGVSPDGGSVSATLGSKKSEYGAVTYMVTELRKK